MPLIVLIDEGTASAAELLAAAVQENRRGTLVGVKTAGAVEVSVFIDLYDGSALSVSVFEITTGRGVRLESAGVKPDVLAALTTFDFDSGQDRQLGWAVRLIKQTLAQRVPP
jgi:carboxyl-terminal processing protease